MQPKYIFTTGGVCSSLGKGLTAASIALLLEKRGLKVAMLKLDPYLNVDPGTMNPFEHGEVYVTDDGGETDLDLGHYYRYTNAPLSRLSNVTSGQIYHTVIKRERKGDYLGKTVQVIPHITDEIKRRIVEYTKQVSPVDVVMIEIGGTIGDIESLPFLEAIRQFRNENFENSLNVHLTYVPYLKAAGEVKTKPSQHSVQALRQIGIFPDFIVCRCEEPLETDVKKKISLFCNVPLKAVIDEPDVALSIYEVPLMLKAQNVDEMICEKFKLKTKEADDLKEWEKLIEAIKHPKGVVKVGIVGKYLLNKDAYKSVFEALHHGANAHGYKLEIVPIEADRLNQSKELEVLMSSCDGFLVPGGFGERGWQGKIEAARYCRENKVPYFGICFGMQVMAVEFARHVLGLKEANSTEIDPTTKEPVISLLSEQKDVQDIGGTMRLGCYPCALKKGSKVEGIYKQDVIEERHRHRFEFNNDYKEAFEKKGLEVVGSLKEGNLCEILELKEHPWMIGVQFHPEFKSKPVTPHPLFNDFIKTLISRKR
jgi:CTP synthase